MGDLRLDLLTVDVPWLAGTGGFIYKRLVGWISLDSGGRAGNGSFGYSWAHSGMGSSRWGRRAWFGSKVSTDDGLGEWYIYAWGSAPGCRVSAWDVAI